MGQNTGDKRQSTAQRYAERARVGLQDATRACEGLLRQFEGNGSEAGQRAASEQLVEAAERALTAALSARALLVTPGSGPDREVRRG